MTDGNGQGRQGGLKRGCLAETGLRRARDFVFVFGGKGREEDILCRYYIQ